MNNEIEVEPEFELLFDFSSFKEAAERAKVLVTKYDGEAVIRLGADNRWQVWGDWVLCQQRHETWTWVEIYEDANKD
ncbi:MAG: hypothetical protein J0L89_08810 [Xanthomonadales bacterium]|nr:hypothetical protein [Xanthomonadales bacterium]